jgi:hypothetical protein
MRLDASGNVGIGTSSPADRLSVAGTVLATGTVTRSGSGTTSFVAFRNNSDVNSFYEARTTAGGIFFGANAANSFAVGPTASGTGNYLRASDNLFFVSTGGSERMRITSAGNVGIGTSSPATTLDVNGQTTLRGSVNLTSGAFFAANGEGLWMNGFASYGAGITSDTAGTAIRLWTSGTERLSINSAGNVTANVDIRAPIFYDSGNTAFYLDPANTGTSLLTAGGVQFYSQDGFRFTSASAISAMRFGSSFTGESTAEIAYNRATGTTTLSQGNTGSALTQTVAITTTGLTLAGTTHYINTDKLLLQHNGTDGYIRSANAGSDLYLGGSNQNTLTLHASNYAVIAGSTRSPFFYDSDNTAFYVDGAGTSVLNIVATDQIRTRSGTQLVLNGGDATGVATGQTGELIYLNAEGGIQINSSPDNWASGWAGRRTATICNASGDSSFPVTVSAGNDFRAPIFYDSNNTASYLDPASTSVINILRANTIQHSSGNTAIALDGPTWTQFCDPNGATKLWLGGSDPNNYYNGNTHFFRDAASSVMATIDSSGIQAPVYYDSNNTAFYLDPAVTCVVNAIQASGLVTGRSSAATDVNTANDTGSFSVRGSTTTVASMSFHRTGAYAINMGLGTDSVFRIGGWSAQSNCLQIFGSGVVQALNDFRAPIFYDSANTTYYVDLDGNSRLRNLNLGGGSGFDATIHIVGVQGGNGRLTQMSPSGASQAGFNIMSARNGSNADLWWSWGVATDNTWRINGGVGFNSSAGISLDASGNLTAGGSVRAPIFYNSNDTNVRWAQNELVLRGGSPTIYFRDTDSNSAMIHCNSNLLYVLRGGNDTESWATVNGQWPLVINLTNNDMTVGGNFTAVGNVTAYSDIRVKDNVEQIGGALGRLQAIRGVTYTRNDLEDKERRYAGVIAQEIEAVLPEAVFESGDKKSVDYNATIGLLIEAIKELETKFETLKKDMH